MSIDVGTLHAAAGYDHEHQLVGELAREAGQPGSRRRLIFGFTKERAGLFGTVAVHALAIVLVTLRFADPLPPSGRTPALDITFINLSSAPPAGSPDGDSAPPKPVEKPAAEAQEVKPVEPDVADPDPKPLPDSPLKSEVPAPAKSPAVLAAQAPEARLALVQGTGSIALGAKTHGDGTGLDGDLAAAVGNAVATQIRACWTAPEIEFPANLSIIMTASFDRDGSLMSEPTITRFVDETAETITEPNAFEIAALDAVTRCAPIQLPPTLYPYWREVDVQIFSSVLPAAPLVMPPADVADEPAPAGSQPRA
ncbi:hypothetical protein [Sphingosinicella sp. BN140058]|uniref:hypothetical protein n=1 Tax=Sphingosinicella sp. BN140058 TaxID=1892855 RepID=UPI0010114934|nr:hypothetical protein [Sphingosinicella sp. BN140058]QAY80347.1 hypothetical protein ETR14_27275 [Sphingosinicella sp. BN140058]